eukprot:768479-Hanusia_phi.AAC.5
MAKIHTINLAASPPNLRGRERGEKIGRGKQTCETKSNEQAWKTFEQQSNTDPFVGRDRKSLISCAFMKTACLPDLRQVDVGVFYQDSVAVSNDVVICHAREKHRLWPEKSGTWQHQRNHHGCGNRL